MNGLERRYFLAGTAALAGGCAWAARARDDTSTDEAEFVRIRAALGEGTRLGVFAVDSGGGRQMALDADGRYAMCSTFKPLLAALVLRLAERQALSFSEELSFGPDDPLANSPVVQAKLKLGKLSIEELTAAVVRYSDNSAANLLLRRVGGPGSVTRFLRACGDRATRLDRYELALNSNILGDLRDTTTPRAMATLWRTLLLGKVFSEGSRNRLTDWLVTSVAKPDRLKAGFPTGWRVGHKPGTGRADAVNDVAIAWPPRKPPIIVASFISGGTAGEQRCAAAHRAIAAFVASRLS